MLRHGVAVVLLCALLGSQAQAETCEDSPTCQAFDASRCVSASCFLRLRKKCDRKGVWLACHTQAERKSLCAAQCAPAIAGECQGRKKCARQKTQRCIRYGTDLITCTTTTTTTTSTTTTTAVSQFLYGGDPDFVGSLVSNPCQASVDTFVVFPFTIRHSEGSTRISGSDLPGHPFSGAATASGFSVSAAWSDSGCSNSATLTATNRPGVIDMDAAFTLRVNCGGPGCSVGYAGTLDY